VSPMNGGIALPSTVTLTSLRGKLTLSTFSSLLNVGFAPVICSILSWSPRMMVGTSVSRLEDRVWLLRL